jgi:predicted dithiol-disulfide oxidoreductase (DUF899 family)
MQHLRFPNESTAYREARNALLAEEMELRRQVERVATHRRALPKGGEVKEDYLFEGESGKVRLSELFGPGKETLAIYSFMFGPERERPCPGCTHFLDALEGSTQHILQRIKFVVVAKSPVPRLQALPASVAGAGCACCRRPATITTATISAIRPRSALRCATSRSSSPARNGTCRS